MPALSNALGKIHVFLEHAVPLRCAQSLKLVFVAVNQQHILHLFRPPSPSLPSRTKVIFSTTEKQSSSAHPRADGRPREPALSEVEGSRTSVSSAYLFHDNLRT